MTLSDIPGKVKLPTYLPLGIVLGLTVAVTLGWINLHNTTEHLEREITELKSARTLSIAEFKAKDAALESRLDAMRDQSTVRQEAVISRLARIETILERLEKSGVRP